MKIVITPDEFERAAVKAIECWRGQEGEFSKYLRDDNAIIDEEFLTEWLKHWMVARSSKRCKRADLAAYLSQCARPKILGARNEELPEMVEEISIHISEQEWSNGRPTSLVSKFACSLVPDVVTPYDKRARRALGVFQRSPIENHDYKSYMSSFNEFVVKVQGKLESEKRKLKQCFNGELERVMPDIIFKRRAADKLLMLVGGFDFNSNSLTCDSRTDKGRI